MFVSLKFKVYNNHLVLRLRPLNWVVIDSKSLSTICIIYYISAGVYWQLDRYEAVL